MLPAVIVVTLIFLIGSIVVLIVKKKCNKKYYYKFFSDRLEYHNSIFNKVKEVRYEEFKEIKYNQGFIQSKFNLGELWILTNNKNFFKKVLMFKAIPNVADEYEKIVKIFNA